MLKELNIKNLAIIDDLTVRLESGLTALTGETGAGKSIIVDALGLALGDRAQTDLIRAGEKEAAVQAFFEIQEPSALPETGIDISEGIVLRRVISNSGKSRAYINDVMVTLQTLSAMGKALVDIHSQHEHQSLLTSEKQRMILDAYGDHAGEIKQVHELYAVVQSLREEFNALRERIKERAHRIDLLRFQASEIDGACLKPGEKQSLEQERKILANLSRLKDATETAYLLLHEADGSCTENLSRVITKLREMTAVDSGISDTLGIAESALPLLEDAAISLRAFRDRYHLDPERLDLVEERLELIRRLGNKYGDSIEAILDYRKKAEEELSGLEASDERLHMLEEELNKNVDMLVIAARRLSEKRKKTAGKIEKLIENNLKDLAFGSAQFKIDIRQETDEAGHNRINLHGMDRIEFIFSANAGEPMKPLAKIASGGELSRVMLCLKSILADVDNVPVLIFDEVDAGIGGRTAESVGRKLLKISDNHQLICITHLPQIASVADNHLKIEKSQHKNSVSVTINELSGAGRQDEIARMLSGTVTDISRRHAVELLERR